MLLDETHWAVLMDVTLVELLDTDFVFKRLFKMFCNEEKGIFQLQHRFKNQFML